MKKVFNMKIKACGFTFIDKGNKVVEIIPSKVPKGAKLSKGY